jgi:hypothetical protein
VAKLGSLLEEELSHARAFSQADRAVVPLDTMWAKARLFNTTHKCIRAGLTSGNLLKRMVSAEGMESATKPGFT